jgi:hypothetical protein
MKKEKVIVSIADGFHWKYLYESGVIANLLKKNIQVVILILDNFNAAIPKDVINSDGLTFIYVNKCVPNKMILFLIMLFPLLTRKYTETENFQKEEFNRKLSFKLRYLISTFAKNKLLNTFFLAILKFFLKNNQIHKIIKQESPDMIIISTPGQKLFDIPIIISAAKLRIKTFCPIYSWDNLTSKGNIVFRPTYLAVWNETMVQEAKYLHEYDDRNIFKLGSPIFEGYFSEKSIKRDVSFVQSIFTDKNIKSYILLTTVPVRFYGYEHINLIHSINKILLELNHNDVGVLVRVHPMDHTDYSEFENNDNVCIDYFGSKKANSREHALESWFPTSGNILHLKKTIVNSTMCINIASTITLEAALCGKKVLNIAYFQSRDSYDAHGKPERFYNYTHYKPIIENDLAKVIYSEDKLSEAISTNIENNNFYNKEISLRAEKFLGADGEKSALMIANKIIELIKKKKKL